MKITPLTPLILANLTIEEILRFNAADIPYSASTAGPENGGLAPYIATYVSELQRAAEAMGWKTFAVDVQQHQYIAKRGECAENYYVLPPVPNGYAFWDVRARKAIICGTEQRNWPMATFSIHMPGAEDEARALCDRLNSLDR